MTCEGGESRTPTQSHPATLTQRSFRQAPSLCSRLWWGKGAKLRLKATSGYSDPKAISPGAKSSLKAKRPSSNSKPPGYSDPKVVSLGAKSSLKAECAERRLKATRLLQPEGRFAGRQVFAQGGEGRRGRSRRTSQRIKARSSK